MITWLLRSIFWALDNLARFAIHLFYSLINQIASASLFQEYIYTFMGRIYAFLTIFMLFKLSISVVNYILNPDQFVDKSKGFGKLIQNVIIVIALIIFVPTIFDWGYKLQCLVLNSGVLNSVITGVKNTMTGEDLTNTCLNDEEGCRVLTDEEKNRIDYNANMITYSIMSGFVYQSDNSDEEFIPSDVSGVKGSAIGPKKQQCASLTYSDGDPDYEAQSDCLFHYDTMTNTKNSYLFLISTACLIFVAYIFLIFTIDVSIRTVKLAFLQLIAPIPIISRIDPNSGKSGMFGKWVKECTKTYGDLFIRLGAVFFAIQLINQLLSDTAICANNMFVKIFIVLGILAFAKQLPQFIENLTGIKMDGGGLNLKKKLGSIPGLGAAKGLATGAVIGGIGAATGAGIGRGFAGAWQGMMAGAKGKSFNEIRKGQVDANAKMRKAIDDGSTFGGRMGARWSSFWGSPGALGRIETDEHAIDERIKDLDNQMAESKRVASQRKQLADNIAAQENRAKEKIKAGEAGNLSTEYLQREAHIETLKGQLSAAAERGFDTSGLEAQIAQAQVDLNSYLNDVAVVDYIDNFGDVVIDNLVNDYNEIARLQGQTIHDGAADRHRQMGQAKGEITRIETQNRPFENEKSALENQKRDLYEDKRTASANKSAI